MKKKILFMFTLFLSIIALNVYALDGEDGNNENGDGDTEVTPSWPKDITVGDDSNFSFTIEGFTLKVYPENGDIEEDENGKPIKIVSEEDRNNYIEGNASRTINLLSKDYKIDLSYQEDVLYKVPTIFIDLGLSLTEENLKDILQKEINDATPTLSYLVELEVNYKLTEYPEKYTHIENTNFMRSILTLASSGSPDEIKNTVNTSQTLSQVVNIIEIAKLSEDSETQLKFGKTLSEDDNFGLYILNPLSFYEEDADEDSFANFSVLFHNVDNIEYLIDNAAYIEENAEEEILEGETKATPQKNQVVQVDNTAKNIETLQYFLALLLIVIGICIITHSVTKAREYN